MSQVIRDIASMNSLAPFMDLLAWSRGEPDIDWHVLSRSLPPEVVALAITSAALARLACPLQMSIIDALTRVGRSFERPIATFPEEPSMSVGHLDRMFTQYQRAGMLPIASSSFSASASTAGSARAPPSEPWLTRVPEDDVDGEEGWEARAANEVKELYDIDVAADSSPLRQIRECLRRASEAVSEADHRATELQLVLGDACKQREKVQALLRAHSRAADSMKASADEAVAGLTKLAADASSKSVEANTEALKRRQHLFMLQKAWTALVGSSASLVPLCCICMQKPIQVACVPCGHTYCQDCSRSLNRAPSPLDRHMNCHVCRKKVVNRQPLYFS